MASHARRKEQLEGIIKFNFRPYAVSSQGSGTAPECDEQLLPADIPNDSAPQILSYCACILQIGFDADGTLVPSCFEPVGHIRHKRIVGVDFERPQEGAAKAMDAIERPVIHAGRGSVHKA
jgi:hypothetical protein